MNLSKNNAEKLTKRLKAYLIADYEKGNKKATYNICFLFKELKIPFDTKYRKAVLQPLLESGFVGVIRDEYLRISIKGIKEIINGRNINKEKADSQ